MKVQIFGLPARPGMSRFAPVLAGMGRLGLAVAIAMGVSSRSEAQAAPGATQPSQALLPGANSPSESAALAYMRTVMRSQYLYKQKHKEFARSPMALVGSGSFTRRMARTDRGDYTVHFTGNGEGYQLWLTPSSFDEQHRSFFTDNEGTIRVDAERAATAQSPPLNTKKK